MSSGGFRENSGRKSTGVVVNTRIDEELIRQVELYIKGISRADKIRKCLALGVEHNKAQQNNFAQNNVNTINRFYKTFVGLLQILDGSESHKINILSQYLLNFFTTASFEKLETIDADINKKIISEFNKFSWSLHENESRPNLITPTIVGSVIEKVVNQKETGAYYTPRDTTNYIAKYSIVFALLCKCNSPALAYNFYEQYGESNNLGVLNSSASPIENLARAINLLTEDEKYDVFESILSFTIVDPTCGTGAFIIAAADIMVELYRLTNLYLFVSLNDYVINLFKNCLFGVDILESAISLIILRSKLYLYNLGISKSVVETIDFQFYCGDSLASDATNHSNENFCWEKNFATIFENGGFDCVIGNPPYVETNKTNVDTSGYLTEKCGNLYTCILEKSIRILKDNSYLGMIVPISIISTQRMESLRQILFNNCENIYIANFSDRPSCLFAGVHQKLSILFVKKTKPTNGCKIYTSQYLHWNKSERKNLFDNVHYCRTTKPFITSNGIAKIGDDIKNDILKKVIKCKTTVLQLFRSETNSNQIFLNQRMTFWTKCFTSPEPSHEYKHYNIDSSINKKAVAALFNSSLFYLLWETYSDGWHITQNDFTNLKVPVEFFEPSNQRTLSKLENDLEQKLYDTREYIYSKQTDYIYVHKKCCEEIEKIDNAIAKIYGFSLEEQNYIKNLNLKYRLSLASDSEDE